MQFVDEAGLTSHGRRALRRDALAIAAAGLVAADPAAALERALRVEGDRLLVSGQPIAGIDERLPAGETAVILAGRRVFLVGAGKATIGMAALLDRLLGERLAGAAVVVKRGQAQPLRHIEVLEAAHPVPDEDSLRAGLRLLAVARQAQPGDLLIGLVTGGSSALAVAPADGISFADKAETNRLLLACGADIVSMNNVRKHLSAIKGGLLGAAAGCEIVNFTVSDVVGDPLDYITDLTVPDSSTWKAAQRTCDRFGLWERLPVAVAARLRRADPAAETPKSLAAVRTWVMADAAGLCAAAAAEAERRGYRVELLGLDWEGEARDAGASLAHRILASPARTCLLAGGENTVTLRERLAAAGSAAAVPAAGGPSQEAAAAAALVLVDAESPAAVLCIDSDGTDGPTEAAGGLVDDRSAARRADAFRAALTTHATHDALATAGDLVVTAPTGTNVNDLKVALSGQD